MLYEIEGEPSRVLERGAGYLTDEARVEDRIGGGHAEGLFEAWSNLYARFAVAMADADKGAYGDFWYPDVKVGAQGIKWIDKCVESAITALHGSITNKTNAVFSAPLSSLRQLSQK